MNGFWNRVKYALLLVIAAAQPALAAPPCAGDCDQGGGVTVDELVKGVGIALGNANIEQCRSVDGNTDGAVTVDELVRAVSSALNGCPSVVGTFFGTVNLDAGRSAQMNLEVQANGQASALVTISESTSQRGAGNSFSITGSVDLDTGAYTLSGSFLDGGTTRTVNVSGVLPVAPTGQGTFNFQVDVTTFSGSIARGDGNTPTPTRTPPPAATPTRTSTPMESGPVDPAMLGTWSGSARNESTGLQKQVRIKIELQGNAVIVTDLGGNLYKTAPASITMSAPTRTTLAYNLVVGNPVIVFNLTLAGNQLGGIYSATTTSFPPMVDAVGLVLTKEVPLAPDPRLDGTWSGTVMGTAMQVRLRLEIQGDGVIVTDLIGDLFVHIPSSITMRLDGAPTFLSYVCDTAPCGIPNPVVTLNLSLLASGRLVGRYVAFATGLDVSVPLNLGKE